MSQPRPTLPRALIAGPLLVIAGLACWALYVRATNTEHHSYAHGGNPPAYVRLELGATYGIAIHGGVTREAELGLAPGTLQCTAARRGESPGPLDVTAENTDTKATDRIGTFVSAIAGDVRLECSGIGAVFVDNAADAPYDWSGGWLVLASILLAIGLPLALSGLRRAGRRVDPPAAGRFEFERYGEADVVGTGRGDHLYAEGQPFGAEPERDLGRG
jgi:hypothetical protein